MSDLPSSDFAEELMAAPAGVTLLARLEVTQRKDTPWYGWPKDCDPDSVRRAAALVEELSLGAFLELAVTSAERGAGPWSGEALLTLPYSYEHAPQRCQIADAVAKRFESLLRHDVDLDAQQWWHEIHRNDQIPPPTCFSNYSNVYGNGEFTWSGLWTVTDPPPNVHDALLSAWDFSGAPTSRWRLPVQPSARVWTIDRPSDWACLVETYPKVATRSHSGWELPGPNQHHSDTKLLRSFTSQRAVRTEIGSHVLPNWSDVAADFDGVHLSWAGFLTSEGFISDLSNGGVTMLRYWGSERTLWLHDVFEEPVPLAAPVLTGSVGGGLEIDASLDDVRRERDSLVIHTL
jgi:hypothetical protein